jgi:hypothetical protein
MKLNVKLMSIAVGLFCLIICGLLFSNSLRQSGVELMPEVQAQSAESDQEAQSHRPRCTLRTIEGTYGGMSEGVFLLDNPQGAPAGPFRVIEIVTNDGRGHATGYGIAGSVNGQIVLDQPYPPLTYTVNPDCTGAVNSPNGLSTRFVIVDGGKEIFYLNTNTGFVVSGVQKRL